MRYFILVLIFFQCFAGLNSFGQKTDSNRFMLTQCTRKIDNISVVIKQYKSLSSSPDIPYCKAYIYLLRDNIAFDSVEFNDIDPVGSDYGLLIYKGLINNHLVISKFGDYDGRTILINDKGRVFNIMGGYGYADTTTGLLFSIYNSDLFGFSVFDLHKDSEILEINDTEDEPVEFYNDSSNTYFLKTINDDTQQENFWKINFQDKKVLLLGKNADKTKLMLLYKLADYNIINIECK